jgi:hypothetical protein
MSQKFRPNRALLTGDGGTATTAQLADNYPRPRCIHRHKQRQAAGRNWARTLAHSEGGADAWIWQDVIAGRMTIGAPPDAFNRLGQNWGLPPFDP